MMRFIATRVHGVADYFTALVIGALPWWSGNYRGGAETWIPVAVGSVILLLAAITDFAPSVVPIVPMSAHLGVEVMSGLLLASAPWLFRFADLGFKSYLVLGALEVGLALSTRTAPRPAPPGAKSAPIGGNLDKPRR
jgi:hypothetical protein